MAEAKRRGYGEDGIYFDHRGDCRDSAARAAARREDIPGPVRVVVPLQVRARLLARLALAAAATGFRRGRLMS